MRSLTSWLLIASKTLLLAGNVLAATLQAAQSEIVPLSAVSTAPYNTTGQIELFDASLFTGRIYGSGVAVGKHVVLSAAHVFYGGEHLGWRQTVVSWYPKRVALDTSGSVSPRAFRVLAGYAEAVEKHSPGDDRSSLEEFNRDAVCLLFYTAAADNNYIPYRADRMDDTGDRLLLGYPFELPQGDIERGRMYASGGPGTKAILRQLGATELDQEGRANQVYQTSDLISGPGGSGGPLLTMIDGKWAVTGVLVGGSGDFSAIAIRSVDTELAAMIEGAIADTSPQIPGNEVWTFPVGGAHYRMLDNDRVVVAESTYITLLDSDGLPIWRTTRKFLGIIDIAVAPSGLIYLLTISDLIAIDGGSGRLLWQFPMRSQDGMKLTVGDDSVVYVADKIDSKTFFAITPAGNVAWQIPALPGTAYIGPDGDIYVDYGGFNALRRQDGSVRWRSSAGGSAVAFGADGTIYAATSGPSVTAISAADGSVLWTSPSPEYLTSLVVGPDGNIAGCGSHTPIRRWTKQGVRLPDIDRPTSSLMVGADGKYVSVAMSSVTAVGPDSVVDWTFAKWLTRPVLGPVGLMVGETTFTGRLQALRTASGAAHGWSQDGGNHSGGNRAPVARSLAPTITLQPLPQQIAEGEELGLYVEAHGSPSLQYQWFRDNLPLTGETSAILRIPTVSAGDAGAYTVEVTNLAGTSRSAEATVTVASLDAGKTKWAKSLKFVSRGVISPSGASYVAGGYSNSTEMDYIAGFGAGGVPRWNAFPADRTYLPGAGNMASSKDGSLVTIVGPYIFYISGEGKTLWQQIKPSNMAGMALAADGVVYVLGDRELVAYAATGSVQWKKTPDSYSRWFSGTPVIAADGRICISMSGGPTSGVVLCLDARGQEIWRANAEGALLGFDSEGALYLASNGSLLRIDAEGRQVGEARDLLFGNTGAIAIAHDGTVFVTSGQKTSALAVTPAGLQVLARQFSGTLLGVTDDGLAIVFDWSPLRIRFVDSAGESVGTFSMEGSILSGLALNGDVLVLTPAGEVRSVSLGQKLADSSWPTVNGSGGNSNCARQAPIPPSISFSSTTVTGRRSDSIILQPNVRGTEVTDYTWSKDGKVLTASAGPTFTISEATDDASGSYTVTARSRSGLVATASVTVVVLPPVAEAGWYRGSTQAGQPFHAFVTPSGKGVILCPELNAGEALAFNSMGTQSFVSTEISGGTISGQFSDDSLSAAATGATFHAMRSAGTDTTSSIFHGTLLPDAVSEMFVFTAGDGQCFWWLRSHAASAAFGNAQWSAKDGSITSASGLITAHRVAGGLRGEVLINGSPRPFFCFGVEPVEESRLVNISARSHVAIGGDPLIAGFVVNGTEPKNVLVRAVGPTLANFGVVERPAASQLHLYTGPRVLAESNEWWLGSDSTLIRSESARLGAFALSEFSSDAALATTLSPGLYTMIVSPRGARSGVMLAEVYDAGTDSIPYERVRLVNISARATVGSGERVLIAGFVVNGTVPLRVLLRAVGPGLLPYGVNAYAADPALTLYQGPTKLLDNDDWGTDTQAVSIARAAEADSGGFALVAGSHDAATVVVLDPGLYTVVVNTKGDPGTALVELYALPRIRP